MNKIKLIIITVLPKSLYNWMRKIKRYRWNFIRKHGFDKYINKADPIIIDIGVHAGGEIAGMFAMWKSAEIYAFEIDPIAIEAFRKMWETELNDNKTKLTLVESAISDQDGKVEFYRSLCKHDADDGEGTTWAMSGSIKAPKLHLERYNISFADPQAVESVRLDTWYDENLAGKIIDLIWADVNGAEKELILGGLNTLQNRVRYFYTEFYNEEIFEGQPNEDWIRSTLTNFEHVKTIDHNMLLKNVSL
ncbi:MAG: FkbM family methyltransferase [Planctomycetes bacterium]|nr:FkbM family methyltransferase [Planctomycetota bacterium]